MDPSEPTRRKNSTRNNRVTDHCHRRRSSGNLGPSSDDFRDFAVTANPANRLTHERRRVSPQLVSRARAKRNDCILISDDRPPHEKAPGRPNGIQLLSVASGKCRMSSQTVPRQCRPRLLLGSSPDVIIPTRSVVNRTFTLLAARFSGHVDVRFSTGSSRGNLSIALARYFRQNYPLRSFSRIFVKSRPTIRAKIIRISDKTIRLCESRVKLHRGNALIIKEC